MPLRFEFSVVFHNFKMLLVKLLERNINKNIRMKVYNKNEFIGCMAKINISYTFFLNQIAFVLKSVKTVSSDTRA